MADSLSLGALELEANTYTSPIDASKDKQYRCIDCNQKAILRRGTIRRPHFAHYSPTNTCSYYDKPSESQIHKDAKLLMVKLLIEQKNIQFTWDCHHCKTAADSYAFQDVPSITYKDGDKVLTEYRDKEGKWIADVAVINSDEVRYIIEIKNTHATTTTCRPEPWYEIDAKRLIEYYEDPEFDEFRSEPGWMYILPCLRKGLQRYCYGSFCYKESWVKRIPGYDSDATDRCCVLCKVADYEPVNDGTTGKFQKEEIRVCTPCLLKDSYEKALRTMYMSAQTNEIIVPVDISENIVSICDGNGFCWAQNNIGGLIQKSKCPHNCKLHPCQGFGCGAMLPIHLLKINMTMCYNCAAENHNCYYLKVPYWRKDTAKAMGAKWNSTKKLWYIDKGAKNLNEIFKTFK